MTFRYKGGFSKLVLKGHDELKVRTYIFMIIQYSNLNGEKYIGKKKELRVAEACLSSPSQLFISFEWGN